MISAVLHLIRSIGSSITRDEVSPYEIMLALLYIWSSSDGSDIRPGKQTIGGHK